MSSNDFEQCQKYFKKALNKQKERDFPAAESFYKRALRYNPMHLDANYLLGTLYAEQGELGKALKFLRQAEEINPRSHMIQNNLGNIYQLTRQFDKAIACYQRALSLEPGMPEVQNNLGNIYKRQEQYEEAERCYRRALLLRPDFVESYCNLGGVLQSLKRYPEAIENFRRVLELSPNYKAAYEGLGVSYLELGEREQAIECFNRFLELDAGDNSEVKLRLAQLNAGAIPERYPAAMMLATYEKKAQNWDSDIQRPGMEFLGPKHVREMLEKLGLPQDRQLDVLDIGCGTGVCGEYLRAYARHLEGVDLSPHMLEQARKKDYYDTLECADAVGYMQNCNRTLDLIVASGVLILFSDLAAVFAAAARLLKPGGLFVFTLYRSESAAVAVRYNLHFAHSEAYIREAAQAAHLQPALLEQQVHEYEFGVPQPGWVVALRNTAQDR
ncbi:MAG: tetratricopeptide repeat protein [Nitrosomonadales bacterium]|nr:tetratricopeptide repeat protein [Nitrosomonadales bacterium]